ncbi:hypothetical protein OG765_28810 [Streptomyces sp. NBC_00555]|uniref:hypothetical protein n=1 Tax=Streptomyces sp. NBC_00555 TaxID=2903662 RepID=UPI002253BFFF|nr:hypothetical protein [Streptomyces sp. NBC_00555]MCX5014949.1 hypothetical protein [Streptomyces sp. NBC_00555]
MTMSKRTRAAVWTSVALGLLAGGTWAGTAVAAPPGSAKVTAPYAQAAAVVNANGSVNRSKGIEAVTKPAAGHYCVELEDKDLDIRKLVPTATLQYISFEYDVRISMWPHPSCGTRTDTFLVITGKPGVYEDASFSIVIP